MQRKAYLGRVDNTSLHHVDMFARESVVSHVSVRLEYGIHYLSRVYARVSYYLCDGNSQSLSHYAYTCIGVTMFMLMESTLQGIHTFLRNYWIAYMAAQQ